jgi:hypothetical protein
MIDFELIDLGPNYPDYFQGFGVCGTGFAHCVTGCGPSQAEAFDDLMECFSQYEGVTCGMVDYVERKIIAENDDPNEIPLMGDEMYYLGLRFNLPMENLVSPHIESAGIVETKDICNCGRTKTNFMKMGGRSTYYSSF